MNENQQSSHGIEIDEVFAQLDPQEVEQFYTSYQFWHTNKRILALQEKIGSLRQQITENAVFVQLVQPSAIALANLARLQACHVDDVALLDQMLERGDEWLDHTMQRLDYCEQLDVIRGNYTEWCEHALEGAYDWIDSLPDSYKEAIHEQEGTPFEDEPPVEAMQILSLEIANRESFEPVEPAVNALDNIDTLDEETEALLLQKLMSDDEDIEQPWSEITLKRPAISLKPSIEAVPVPVVEQATGDSELSVSDTEIIQSDGSLSPQDDNTLSLSLEPVSHIDQLAQIEQIPASDGSELVPTVEPATSGSEQPVLLIETSESESSITEVEAVPVVVEQTLYLEEISQVEQVIQPEPVLPVEQAVQPEPVPPAEQTVQPEAVLPVEQVIQPEPVPPVEQVVQPEPVPPVEQIVQPVVEHIPEPELIEMEEITVCWVCLVLCVGERYASLADDFILGEAENETLVHVSDDESIVIGESQADTRKSVPAKNTAKLKTKNTVLSAMVQPSSTQQPPVADRAELITSAIMHTTEEDADSQTTQAAQPVNIKAQQISVDKVPAAHTVQSAPGNSKTSAQDESELEETLPANDLLPFMYDTTDLVAGEGISLESVIHPSVEESVTSEIPGRHEHKVEIIEHQSEPEQEEHLIKPFFIESFLVCWVCLGFGVEEEKQPGEVTQLVSASTSRQQSFIEVEEQISEPEAEHNMQPEGEKLDQKPQEPAPQRKRSLWQRLFGRRDKAEEMGSE